MVSTFAPSWIKGVRTNKNFPLVNQLVLMRIHVKWHTICKGYIQLVRIMTDKVVAVNGIDGKNNIKAN